MSLPKTITHLLPTGAIILWGGVDMPNGFLLCNGASVNKADYPDLADALGETGTTFSLPDYRDRVPQGAGTISPNVSIEAGLPDVYGQFRSRPYCVFYTTGAIAMEQIDVDSNYGYSSLDVESYHINTSRFYASQYDSIYGNSSTAQMAAYTNHFLIKA